MVKYVDGKDVTNNKHLAEAIDLTREGMAPPGGVHDEVEYPNDNIAPTNRDSAFISAIDALQKINSAPAESQEKIDEVVEILQSSGNAPNEQRQVAMARAHDVLQDVWVPPTEG